MSSTFESYREYLLSIANRWVIADLRSKAGGSDLVQDALISAWQSSQVQEPPSKGRAYWLRRILRNRFHAVHRHYSSSKRSYALELPLNEHADISQSQSPDCDAIHEEERALLYDALARLKNHEQLILMLRAFESRSWKEVSAIVGVSEDAARQCYRRAIEKMRSHFIEKNGADE